MVRKEPGCIPEFGGQLRSEAAARFSEPRFRSCHAGEHTLQPLRTQHQEPEREDEKNVCAKTHTSPPVYTLLAGGMFVSALSDVSCSLMADLNPRIPSPIPLPSSGSFLGPKTSRAIPKITSRCIG